MFKILHTKFWVHGRCSIKCLKVMEVGEMEGLICSEDIG